MSPSRVYEQWKPGGDAAALVMAAREICEEYIGAGYDLTLRQLYYQFVARGLIPNTQQSYKRLGDVINRARMAGLLDWDYITDRTRNLQVLPHWRSPQHILNGAAQGYRIDRWERQPTRVEVWVEKEALAGVVGQVAQRYDVPFFACRGYVSQSEQWAAAQRILQYLQDEQNVVILHLGDHDPSGIDMTRDIRERLRRFLVHDWAREVMHPAAARESRTYAAVLDDIRDHLGGREPLEIRRIALNMEQVRQYDPPPNPAKMTDSRVGRYLEQYGDESWELDALPPNVLDALIASEIEALILPDVWAEDEAREQRERDLLGQAADNWPKVQRSLARYKS